MQGSVSPQKARLKGLSGPEEGEKGTAQSGETVGPRSPLNNMRQGQQNGTLGLCEMLVSGSSCQEGYC